MATNPTRPFATQRRVFIGSEYIRYRGPHGDHYSSMPERITHRHVSIEDALLLSVLMVFWGLVFLFVLEAWVL